VRAAMDDPESSDLRLPMGASIAWRMLESWVAAG
jgi:hypothetical protein